MGDIFLESVEALSLAKSVGVITGAGISSESGIPTFRGENGLWKKYRPEELANTNAFAKNPKLVWEWYDWRRGICRKAKPNPAHTILTEMEKYYSDFLLITQNVDGLHKEAGSKKIAEIHGNIWKARCTVCGKIFEELTDPLKENPVHCPACGGLARPHILWFNESYDSRLLQKCEEFLKNCDVLLIIGTSGMVSIPVVLTMYAAKSFKIEINPNRSDITDLVNASFREKSGEFLPKLWENIKGKMS